MVVLTGRWKEAVVLVMRGPRATELGATAPGRDGTSETGREGEDIVDDESNGGDIVESVTCTFNV